MIGLLDRSFKKLDKLAFYKSFVYLVDKTTFCVINQQCSQYHGCAHMYFRKKTKVDIFSIGLILHKDKIKTPYTKHLNVKILYPIADINILK